MSATNRRKPVLEQRARGSGSASAAGVARRRRRRAGGRRDRACGSRNAYARNRDEDARRADDEERGAPPERVADRAAERDAQPEADEAHHLLVREHPAALARGVVVGEQARGRRFRDGLTEPEQRAQPDERREVLRGRGEHRDEAPARGPCCRSCACGSSGRRDSPRARSRARSRARTPTAAGRSPASLIAEVRASAGRRRRGRCSGRSGRP